MQQASLPGVGTNWHKLKLAFSGNEIGVYYDTNKVIDVTDVEATPYSSGGISIDFRSSGGADTMDVDDVVVNALPAGLPAGLAQSQVVPRQTFFPVIESVRVADGVAVITWTAIPGNTYRLQYTEDISQPEWLDATPDIVATDSSVTATNIVGDAPKRFYRVLAP
jgi:hypothetical protein